MNTKRFWIRLTSWLLLASLLAALGPTSGATVAAATTAGQVEPGSELLKDHPETKRRIAAINRAAAAHPAASRPLLAPAEWDALKRICG